MIVVRVQDGEGTSIYAADAISFLADGTCLMSRFTGQPDPAVLRNHLTGWVTVFSPSGQIMERREIKPKEKVDA